MRYELTIEIDAEGLNDAEQKVKSALEDYKVEITLGPDELAPSEEEIEEEEETT